MESKKNNTNSFAIAIVLLFFVIFALTAVAGVVIMINNLFSIKEPIFTFFQGSIYFYVGLISMLITICLAALHIYTEEVRDKKEEKDKDKQSPLTTTFVFGKKGTAPKDMTDDIENYNNIRDEMMRSFKIFTSSEYLKDMYEEENNEASYLNSLKYMSKEQLNKELKIQEKKEDFEKAAFVRDELKKRQDEE